jgi:hypothetical protein
MLKGVNPKQVSVAVISALAFIAAATAMMEPLFGHSGAIAISSGAALLSGLISAMVAPFLGDASVVRDASSVDGARVVVSTEAPPAIAALATDPTAPFVQAEHGQEAAVAQIAKGA